MYMKTIAQQLNVTDFPFRIKDKNGNQTYFENSGGFWVKQEYDSNGNLIHYENSDGDWIKWEYDSNGKEIYSEDSNGIIVDKRPKVTFTMKEIAEKLEVDVETLQIKD